MQMRWLRRTMAAAVPPVLALMIALPAQSQSAALSALGWSGWARCEIDVQGPGFSEQQTHTWTMSGSPSVAGAFRVYPGTWSVAGSGSLQRTQGSQSLDAQWATNVPPVSAPLAVFVRASDGRMFIQPRHTQLRARDAVQGYQQLTVGGKPQKPVAIGLEAFEWTFPMIDVSPPAPGTTDATANGSRTQATTGSVGPMQPAGSRGTASCTWQFGQRSTAPGAAGAVAPRGVPTPPQSP